MATEWTFNEQLKMSEGVNSCSDIKTILMQNIPGALNVIKAHKENDRTGVDWWVEMPNGRFLAVDSKIRSKDWSQKGCDDLALETWSVIEERKVGWTRDTTKNCDYILWLWKDTGRWCLIPFRMLCKVFQDNWKEWCDRFDVKQQRTISPFGNYHSECVFVDRNEVWASIYETYSGAC